MIEFSCFCQGRTGEESQERQTPTRIRRDCPPPRPAVANPSPPAPPPQDAVRRRLSLGGYTSPVDDSDSVPASRSPSPAVVCSQYRLQQLKEGIISSRYPTPPAAPPKDGYIYESEDESQSPLRQAPARVFRHGKLKIHKTYNGPVPLTYVDTGVYEGGSNDYYEAYTEQDLYWARRLDYVLKYHRIPRWEACDYKKKM